MTAAVTARLCTFTADRSHTKCSHTKATVVPYCVVLTQAALPQAVLEVLNLIDHVIPARYSEDELEAWTHKPD